MIFFLERVMISCVDNRLVGSLLVADVSARSTKGVRWSLSIVGWYTNLFAVCFPGGPTFQRPIELSMFPVKATPELTAAFCHCFRRAFKFRPFPSAFFVYFFLFTPPRPDPPTIPVELAANAINKTSPYLHAVPFLAFGHGRPFDFFVF